MNIYTGLLFQQGFIQDPKLALSLAGVAPAATRSHKLAAIPQRSQNVAPATPCKPFKRGAIAAVCSIALSPFR